LLLTPYSLLLTPYSLLLTPYSLLISLTKWRTSMAHTGLQGEHDGRNQEDRVDRGARVELSAGLY
ncbi:hypothetical protein GC175_01680, partial [bacterium]|nr:hypothetical protein [bacterium]